MPEPNSYVHEIQVALLALLVSATAGVALLALLASHRTATQSLFIIEVIKLSSYVHSVENQDSRAKMHGCQRSMCATSEFACYMYAFVGVCQWCMHSWSCCCRGFVEAYRDLLEIVCEA